MGAGMHNMVLQLTRQLIELDSSNAVAAISLRDQAYALAQLGQHKQALIQLEQALHRCQLAISNQEYHRNVNREYLLELAAAICRDAAEVCQTMQDHKMTIVHLKQALAFLEQAGDLTRYQRALIRLNYAIALDAQGELTEAEIQLKLALKEFELTKEADLAAKKMEIYVLLARIAFDRAEQTGNTYLYKVCDKYLKNAVYIARVEASHEAYHAFLQSVTELRESLELDVKLERSM
jgi:tetratricopeptide (TPR) repeat protein